MIPLGLRIEEKRLSTLRTRWHTLSTRSAHAQILKNFERAPPLRKGNTLAEIRIKAVATMNMRRPWMARTCFGSRGSPVRVRPPRPLSQDPSILISLGLPIGALSVKAVALRRNSVSFGPESGLVVSVCGQSALAGFTIGPVRLTIWPGCFFGSRCSRVRSLLNAIAPATRASR